MEENKSIIPELKEHYRKFKYNLIVQSKTDPENQPYKSKYEAREILHEMKNIINDQVNNETQRNDLLANVFCLISSLSYDIEEPSCGTEFAEKSLDSVPSPIHPSRITCTMTCLNNLGFWSCQNENFNKAQEWLEKSEEYYYRYNEEIKDKALDCEQIFTGESSKIPENGFERCHTQTLFYLAQVYSKKGNLAKSAKCCHKTLNRQLESGEETPVEWALNAATLSQYLIEQNAFKEARHHLAASLIVLEKYDLEVDELLAIDKDNEESKAKYVKIYLFLLLH